MPYFNHSPNNVKRYLFAYVYQYFSHSGLENGRITERRFEQPRLMPVHWSLLGRSHSGELLMPEENNKNGEQQQDNGEITDDGNYSRPTGTSAGSVFITRYIYFGRSYHVKRLNFIQSVTLFVLR